MSGRYQFRQSVLDSLSIGNEPKRSAFGQKRFLENVGSVIDKLCSFSGGCSDEDERYLRSIIMNEKDLCHILRDIEQTMGKGYVTSFMGNLPEKFIQDIREGIPGHLYDYIRSRVTENYDICDSMVEKALALGAFRAFINSSGDLKDYRDQMQCSQTSVENFLELVFDITLYIEQKQKQIENPSFREHPVSYFKIKMGNYQSSEAKIEAATWLLKVITGDLAYTLEDDANYRPYLESGPLKYALASKLESEVENEADVNAEAIPSLTKATVISDDSSDDSSLSSATAITEDDCEEEQIVFAQAIPMSAKDIVKLAITSSSESDDYTNADARIVR
ncbi:MAG: hypothetical protein P1U74_08760 [Legionellaceae bacterium]|nr:hypothetical protein [Legionellaceae bacterium]